jgi:hypothetical protein
VPVWGAVVGHDLYTYGERNTVKARNLARDPRAVVHLESAEHVAVVHGRLEDLGRPQDAGRALWAFDAKYGEPGDSIRRNATTLDGVGPTSKRRQSMVNLT